MPLYLISKLDPQQLPPTVLSQEVSSVSVLCFIHLLTVGLGMQISIQSIIVCASAETPP